MEGLRGASSMIFAPLAASAYARAALLLECIACQTRCGDAGMSMR
jgi:hypothetical protein